MPTTVPVVRSRRYATSAATTTKSNNDRPALKKQEANQATSATNQKRKKATVIILVGIKKENNFPRSHLLADGTYVHQQEEAIQEGDSVLMIRMHRTLLHQAAANT
jgi:hypothetical protein